MPGHGVCDRWGWGLTPRQLPAIAPFVTLRPGARGNGSAGTDPSRLMQP